MENFFVSGFNKSGTTFLQMLINSHPNASCPSEHHLNSFLEIPQLTKRYHQIVKMFDDRTAKQGVVFNEAAFNEHIIKSAIDFLFSSNEKQGVTHTGINDNSLINNIALWHKLFPNAKYLFIVRDPRDVGISLWHHKMRTEADFKNSNTPLEFTVKAVLDAWPNHIMSLLRFSEKTESVNIVKYEDLIGSERIKSLQDIFAFLGLKVSKEQIDKIFEDNSFEKLKNNSDTKGEKDSFYRSGKRSGWKETLPENLRQYAVERCYLALREFNYEC